MTALRPEEIPNKSLLSEEGAASVFIVYDGVRYGFPSVESLLYAEFTFSDVKTVPPGSLINIPRIPPEGSYVQEWRTGRLYLISRGCRLRMEEDDLFERGATIAAVRGVPWGTLEGIPGAGRYRKWKVGALAWAAIPLSRLAVTPGARAFGAWFVTAFLGGIASGATVAWLFGGS